jgi:hypothetical protein
VMLVDSTRVEIADPGYFDRIIETYGF